MKKTTARLIIVLLAFFSFFAIATVTLESGMTGGGGATTAAGLTNVPAGNLAAINVQTALDELQTDIDTRATATSVTDHVNDTTAAHAGSAIANTPAGNLAATTVQTALDELQTDINTRAVAVTKDSAGITAFAQTGFDDVSADQFTFTNGTESWDSNGIADTNSFTVSRTGRYFILVWGYSATNNTAHYCSFYYKVNAGSLVTIGNYRFGSSAAYAGCDGSVIVNLTAADDITMWGVSSNGDLNGYFSIQEF